MGLKTFKNSRKGVECGSCELIVGTVNAYLLEEMKKATKSSVRLPVSQNKIQTRNLQIYEKRYSTGWAVTTGKDVEGSGCELSRGTFWDCR
jgi:hypothetical protein